MTESTPNRPAFNLSAAAKAIQGLVNLTLIAMTVRDILQRSEAEIKGNRQLWLLAAFLPPMGPIAYLIFGRNPRSSSNETTPASIDLP